MYYIVFFFLLLFSVREYNTGQKDRRVFLFSYVLMSCLAIFRYGQLTDYFNYEIAYLDTDTVFRDPLYGVLMDVFRTLGIRYIYFSMFLDFVAMLLSYRFFSRICQKSQIALFAYYCYTFMLCPMSAIRQSICLSLLLFSFSFLLEKRTKLFYLFTLIGSLIHMSMIAVIIIGPLMKIKSFNKDSVRWVIFASFLMSFFFEKISVLMPSFISERIAAYMDGALESGESNLFQMFLRILLIIPILYIKPPYGSYGYYAKSICIIGFCLYCFLSIEPLTAGRIEYYFRTFIGLFMVYVVFEMKRTKLVNQMIVFLFLIHSVLWIKNINSFIDQGDYNRDKVSIYNFPYISIFDKEELENYK